MKQKKILKLSIILITAVLALAGCTRKKPALTDGREVYVKGEQKEKEAESAETKKPKQERLFLVTGIDTLTEKITLKGYKEDEEISYNYSSATFIRDKYGNETTIEKLSAGEMVNAEIEQDTIESIQMSDEVFTYGDIHNFTLNIEEKNIIIGKNSYYYEDDIQVFHNNNKISIGEISEWDTICLKGIKKKVYAIQVTSGHGTVVLENTGLFEGGNITIGNEMSLEIAPNMKIEVPEGTHLLSVANDGYGGSREITVEANREITINLEELKGEGPKTGTVAFKIEPENATLYLNGEVVDLSQALQLKYGRYKLSARAEGYADWDRTLVVNSERANFKIELKTEEEAAKEDEQEKSTETQSGKEQEEAVKKLIEQIRNGTLSTSDDSNTAGAASGRTEP